MMIPEQRALRDEHLKWVLDTCLMSRMDRKNMYDRRRQFYLYGTSGDADILYNRLEPHIDLVCSFLFSGDHAEYDLAAPLNAPPQQIGWFAAAKDKFNEDFRDADLFDEFADALLWSTVMDTWFLKMGWSETRKQVFASQVPPWKLGVFADEETDFDSQEAFVHCYHIDYDHAVQRMHNAGLDALIDKLNVVNTPFESPFPDTLTRMIISSTSGENLAGNVTGAVNPSYVSRPTYHAKVDRPLVGFYELYVWDDQCEDYRLFTAVDPGIFLTDSKAVIGALANAKGQKRIGKEFERFYNTHTNEFFPQEHPFVQVRPYTMFDYFWGKSHLESLIPLQEWSSERLAQIHDILDKQAYPPRMGSGMMGLSDEKMEAFGGADTWVIDQLPAATIKEYPPEMPPDIFQDYMSIGMLMMEASGLTEILQGKGGEGVRSKSHAKQLQTTGAGRIKKTATRLEAPLVRMGELALKLMQRNSDEAVQPDGGDAFLYANLGDDYTLRIAGHSHSPLFIDDTKELAMALIKTQSIDQEAFIRMLNPPNRAGLIQAYRQRQKAKAAMAQQRMAMGLPPEEGPPPRRGKSNGAGAKL